MTPEEYKLAGALRPARMRHDTAEVERLTAELKRRGWDVFVGVEHDGALKTYVFPATREDE